MSGLYSKSVWRKALGDLIYLIAQASSQPELLQRSMSRLHSRLRCERVTYLRCTQVADGTDYLVVGHTFPENRAMVPMRASSLSIFGEELLLAEGATRAQEMSLSKERQLYRGYVAQITSPTIDAQHILCITHRVIDVQAIPPAGSRIPLHILHLFSHISRSLERIEIETKRGTRTQAVERIMRKTGNVKEVAAEICDTLRQFLGVPAVRLWLLNRQFGNLDLLYFSMEPEYEAQISLTLNRLSGKSIGMEAIRQRSVIRVFRPWESELWEEDQGLILLLDQLPMLTCIPVISPDARDPVSNEPRLVGLLDLHHNSNYEVPENDQFLLFIGKIIAAALLRARSFERFEVTKKLNAVALKFVNPRGRRPLEEQRGAYLNEVLQITSEALNANCVSIFEADDTGEALRCVATTGLECTAGTAVYHQGGDVTWQVFDKGENINKEILDGELLFSEKLKLKESEISPFLAIPLAGEHRPTGVIRVREKKWHYDERHLQRFATHDVIILETIAASVSPILQLMRMQAHRELFIERTSHQVNQPLQGVLAYSSNILDGLYDKEPAKRDQKLRYIRQMARACAGMMRSNVWLSGVTDFSDLRDAVRKDTRRLTEYFIERIIDLQPIREAENIRVELVNSAEADVLGEFSADEVFFEQAVQNILHNAIKYSYPGTTVKVRLERVQSSLCVYVASVGVPIPPSERERIFWDRERGTVAAAYDQIGTGQGLYIARQIMRGLGGDIVLLESAPDLKAKAPSGFPAAERTTFKIIYSEAFSG